MRVTTGIIIQGMDVQAYALLNRILLASKIALISQAATTSEM